MSIDISETEDISEEVFKTKQITVRRYRIVKAWSLAKLQARVNNGARSGYKLSHWGGMTAFSNSATLYKDVEITVLDTDGV